jgi:hypothetical protein
MVKRIIQWLLLILLIYFSKYCKNRRTTKDSLIRESRTPVVIEGEATLIPADL